MEQISAIIVDDEPLAREGLSIRLNEYDSFSILAKCSNGGEALQTIESASPDVVFVDIEMPGLNGIELIEALSMNDGPMPMIIFVTAFKEFALKAFNCHAFDYILKPYSDERLAECVSKIRDAMEQRRAHQQQGELDSLISRKTGKSLTGFIQSLNHASQSGLHDINEVIPLKSGTEWLRVRVDDILWLEAAGDYVCVHTIDENHIVRKPLKTLHEELCKERFLRLNRSAIVNVSKVVKLTPNSNGEYIAYLNNGANIKVSRRYRLMVKELSGQP